MNEWSELFSNIQDGDTVVLESRKVYHARPEDSFALTGFYCSNTARKNENPNGARSAAAFLQGRRNVTVDGNGAVLLIHGKMTPFVFRSCENITVRNLTVDYACPTMTEFTVLRNDAGVCDIRFHPDCRFRVDGSRLFWRGEDAPDGKPYWEDESNGPHRFVKVYDPVREVFLECDKKQLTFETIEQLDAHTLRVTPVDRGAAFTPGCTFQTRNIIRDQTGALFERCKDLRFENLRIKFMHGLGMVAQFCENVRYADCDLTPGEGRVAASTADFFQFSGCRGLLEIVRCRAHGAHDDYVNVHGTHLRIVETEPDAHALTVRFMHPETWGFQAFEAGDTIEYIRRDTLQPYAQAQVRAFTRLDDTDIRLALDRPLPAGIAVGGDVVENASWTPDLTVRDCDFGPTWGRGILCTTRGKVRIENNRFYHLQGPALLVEDDCNFWFESGYTRDVVFRGNAVIGCDHGCTYAGSPVIRFSPKVMDSESTALVHGKLTLTDNDFRQAYTGFHTVRLEYVAEAQILRNRCDAPLRVDAVRCGKIEQTNSLKATPHKSRRTPCSNLFPSCCTKFS